MVWQLASRSFSWSMVWEQKLRLLNDSFTRSVHSIPPPLLCFLPCCYLPLSSSCSSYISSRISWFFTCLGEKSSKLGSKRVPPTSHYCYLLLACENVSPKARLHFAHSTFLACIKKKHSLISVYTLPQLTTQVVPQDAFLQTYLLSSSGLSRKQHQSPAFKNQVAQ